MNMNTEKVTALDQPLNESQLLAIERFEGDIARMAGIASKINSDNEYFRLGLPGLSITPALGMYLLKIDHLRGEHACAVDRKRARAEHYLGIARAAAAERESVDA